MNKKAKNILSVVIAVLSGIFWRLSGKGGFKNAKVFRRYIIPLLCLGMMSMYFTGELYQWLIAFGLLLWCCVSYMEWTNYIVRLWLKNIDVEREYIWGFTVEGLVGFSSIFAFKHDWLTIALVLLFTAIFGFGKVCIDKCIKNHADVYSELFCGAWLACGLLILCLM